MRLPLLAFALLLVTGRCASIPPAIRATDGGVAVVADAPEGSDAAPTDPCDAPVATPARGHDPFYAKALDADGLPILSSAGCSDEALRAACRVARGMLGGRADLRAVMRARGARIAVMARTERTLDVPEHSDLQREFPDTDWNARARGLGGTASRPATSCAEENLRCELIDRYRGENILVHELAHGVMNLGLDPADPAFRGRVEAAFSAARAAGLWANTYAGSNAEEYWAEGVQDYFDANRRADPPDGIHNAVSTRDALRAYDPTLFALVAEVFGDAPWRPRCP